MFQAGSPSRLGHIRSTGSTHKSHTQISPTHLAGVRPYPSCSPSLCHQSISPESHDSLPHSQPQRTHSLLSRQPQGSCSLQAWGGGGTHTKPFLQDERTVTGAQQRLLQTNPLTHPVPVFHCIFRVRRIFKSLSLVFGYLI